MTGLLSVSAGVHVFHDTGQSRYYAPIGDHESYSRYKRDAH